MFDFTQVIEFAKAEPGHGLLQSVLLFMIWWQSKGLRKEIVALRDGMTETKSIIEKRFINIENRIVFLETRGK